MLRKQKSFLSFFILLFVSFALIGCHNKVAFDGSWKNPNAGAPILILKVQKNNKLEMIEKTGEQEEKATWDIIFQDKTTLKIVPEMPETASEMERELMSMFGTAIFTLTEDGNMKFEMMKREVVYTRE